MYKKILFSLIFLLWVKLGIGVNASNNAVEEVFLTGDEVLYNTQKVPYTFENNGLRTGPTSDSIYKDLLEPRGNAIVVKVAYKEHHNNKIKEYWIYKNRKLAAYTAGVTKNDTDFITFGTNPFNFNYDNSFIEDVFGPRGLLTTSTDENINVATLDSNALLLKSYVKNDPSEEGYYHLISKERSNQLCSKISPLIFDNNSNNYYTDQSDVADSKLLNVPRGFKDSEQLFLNDLWHLFESKKFSMEGLIGNIKYSDLDFVLLSIMSTNSACENCFTSLKSLLSNYRYKANQPTLKEIFLTVFFGGQPTLDMTQYQEHAKNVPLHVVYTSSNFPAYRSCAITKIHNHNSYEFLDLYSSPKRLFIHNIYKPYSKTYHKGVYRPLINPNNDDEMKENNDNNNNNNNNDQ